MKSEIFETLKVANFDLYELLDVFEEGILIFNQEFIVESANSRAAQLIGISQAKLLGKSCMELFHSTDRICPVCQIPNSSQLDNLNSIAPIGLKPLRIIAKTLLNENGELQKIVHRIFDPSVDSSLSLSNGMEVLMNQRIYEKLPMSFQVLDCDYQVLKVNSLWLKTFGYLRSQVEGTCFLKLLSSASRSIFEKKIRKFRQQGFTSGLELRIRKSSGRYLYVLLDSVFQLDEENGVRQNLCFLKVIQEQKSYEKSLEKERKRAELESQKKSAFLANMSHEIRNPMNGILGFTELLRQQDLKEDQKSKYLDLIQNNGEVLLNLINDIMNISRLDAGQVELVFKRFSLSELLNFLHEHFVVEKSVMGLASVKLTLEIDDFNDGNFISFDQYRLQQVLSNLIYNALKFTSEGEVKFGFTLKEEVIQFFVSDTGIGIAPGDQKDIFDRYQQVGRRMGQNQNGNGLGLSICKGIVDLFQGQIWVESQVEKGSTFFFSIPFSPGSEENVIFEPRSEPSSDCYDWSSRTILIAEDEIMNYLFLEELLSQTKVTLLHAENGQEALDIIAQNSNVDMVLMDIKMPVLDGLETTRIIKGMDRVIPVIAQTAYSMEEDSLKCKMAGCDEYISKPIDIPLLLSMIDKYFQ